MGDVYLAEDTRLGRKVALKSPTESWLRSPDARARLHREARAAARLNHPFIAAIYDVLDIDDRPYIVIEYVEGESLSAVLKRGPLPVERAVAIAMQLCDALAVAHEAGVIHRDLKPANVMITPSGGVKVLDFGLARTAEARTDGSSLTEAGQMLGTPDYMAPEQFVGRTADERTDIYSLGALLYELVTGTRPFAEVDPLGRILGSLSTPPPASSRNERVPAALDAVLARALALDPDHRFHSAAEFKRDLERLTDLLSDARTGAVARVRARWWPLYRRRWRIAVVALAIAAAAGAPFAWRWATTPAVRSDVPVVAVIPLRNDTGDPANEYLGQAFADSLITGLAAVRSLAVVSRVPVADLDKAAGDPRRIAAASGASYVIDGSVQRAGPRLKVNIRVVQPDNAVAWAREFDDTLENIFELQRRVAVGVSEGLRVALSPAELQRLAVPPTANIAALRAYTEAQAWVDRESRPGATDTAIDLFREAIDRDPKFALAYSGLGDALWQRYRVSKAAADAEAAMSASEHARSLDPDSPLIRLSLARSYFERGRLPDAEAELQAVLTLQPNNDDARRLRGQIYSRLGNFDGAIDEYQQAIRIRPQYWRNHSALGALYYRTGRFAEAAIAYQKVLDLQPDNGYALMNMGVALHAAGDIPRATEYYKRSIDVAPTELAYSNLGHIYYGQQRFDEAIAAFEAAIRLAPSRPLLYRNAGDAYARKGDRAAAVRAYERAIELATANLSVNPRDADTMTIIALCEAKLSRLPAARARAAQAVALDPESSTVLFRAASVEALAGRAPEALTLLERAIAKGFSRSLARESDDFATLRGDPRFARAVGDPQRH